MVVVNNNIIKTAQIQTTYVKFHNIQFHTLTIAQEHLVV